MPGSWRKEKGSQTSDTCKPKQQRQQQRNLTFHLAFPQVHRMCRCQASYAGADCSIDIGANPHVELLVDESRLGGDVPAPSGRVGHTMVSCGDHKLYVFGGYNLEEGLLSDMWRYDTHSGEWEVLAPRIHRPRARLVLLGLDAYSVPLV